MTGSLSVLICPVDAESATQSSELDIWHDSYSSTASIGMRIMRPTRKYRNSPRFAICLIVSSEQSQRSARSFGVYGFAGVIFPPSLWGAWWGGACSFENELSGLGYSAFFPPCRQETKSGISAPHTRRIDVGVMPATRPDRISDIASLSDKLT